MCDLSHGNQPKPLCFIALRGAKPVFRGQFVERIPTVSAITVLCFVLRSCHTWRNCLCHLRKTNARVNRFRLLQMACALTKIVWLERIAAWKIRPISGIFKPRLTSTTDRAPGEAKHFFASAGPISGGVRRLPYPASRKLTTTMERPYGVARFRGHALRAPSEHRF